MCFTLLGPLTDIVVMRYEDPVSYDNVAAIDLSPSSPSSSYSSLVRELLSSSSSALLYVVQSHQLEC